RSLTQRMNAAAEREQFELAAKYRDLISTVDQLQQKQRIASAEGTDTDVFGYHFENHMVAVNLFHVRGGRVLDRREMFWEDLPEVLSAKCEVQSENENREPKAENPSRSQFALGTSHGFDPGPFFSALLKQIYVGQQYVPAEIFVP